MQRAEFFPPGLIALIDPDRYSPAEASLLARNASEAGVAAIWVGGTFLHTTLDSSVIRAVVHDIGTGAGRPPVLSILGLSSPEPLLVDGLSAVLLPLVGTLAAAGELFRQAWRSTPILVRACLPVIPLAYFLVDGGHATSASHGLQGLGIPRSKPEIAATMAHCAGFIGAAGLFLDAGSNAAEPVPLEIVTACRGAFAGPLVVGGGLRCQLQVQGMVDAGADNVVIGSLFEEGFDTSLLAELIQSARRSP